MRRAAPAGRRPRPPGFTLIELVMVVVIIGIGAGLAAPRMSGMTNRYRTDRLANEIAADIAMARASATRAARPVRVDVTAAGYTIIRDGITVKAVDVASQHPGASLAFRPSGATTGVLGSLRFNSRGVLPGSQVDTVLIVRAGVTVKLPVLMTGMVKRAP